MTAKLAPVDNICNMKQDKMTVRLDSIDTYNKLYGLETMHHLVTVIKYGRRPYDYQEGSVVSFVPGQQVTVDTETDEVAPDVTGLMFHTLSTFRACSSVSRV